MQPRLTVSGFRGVWGETLTPAIARKYFELFVQFLRVRNGERIILARDARHSGGEIVAIAREVFTSCGIDITDIGIAPTPTALFLVRNLGYDGAVIITASHNPIEYNGLKFVTSSGMFTNKKEVGEMLSYGSNDVDHSEMIGEYILDTTLPMKHVLHILDHVAVAKIQEKKLKVVLDTINSTGAITTPTLLEKLGCEVIVINGIPDGNFAHIPEPLPENLTVLGEKVREVGADIGFAQDPDADRLVICDETGEVVFEEYTLALAVESVLSRSLGPVVINMSTSNTISAIAEKYGIPIYRTAVGEANVVAGIVETGAVIGGEGGGGVIYPAINLCRDSLTGIALILELLAHSGKKVSELVTSLPHFEMRKVKKEFSGDLFEVYEKMKAHFVGGTVNEIDGLRIDFPNHSWIQLRASNTEPIVRIMGEAKTSDEIDKLVSETITLIG